MPVAAVDLAGREHEHGAQPFARVLGGGVAVAILPPKVIAQHAEEADLGVGHRASKLLPDVGGVPLNESCNSTFGGNGQPVT